MQTKKKPTQKELVLQYMKDFGSITAMQAFEDLGITHINGRIRELRNSGIRIKTEKIEGKNRYGEKIRYGRFSIDDDSMKGEQLDIFSFV